MPLAVRGDLDSKNSFGSSTLSIDSYRLVYPQRHLVVFCRHGPYWEQAVADNLELGLLAVCLCFFSRLTSARVII